MSEPQLTEDEFEAWWARYQTPLLSGLPEQGQRIMKQQDRENLARQPYLRRQVRALLARPRPSTPDE